MCENTFQQQRDALTDCLEGIDQQVIKLAVYIDEYRRLYASLNALNAKIPELGGAPLAIPEAIAGDSIESVVAERIDCLKSQGKVFAL